MGSRDVRSRRLAYNRVFGVAMGASILAHGVVIGRGVLPPVEEWNGAFETVERSSEQPEIELVRLVEPPPTIVEPVEPVDVPSTVLNAGVAPTLEIGLTDVSRPGAVAVATSAVRAGVGSFSLPKVDVAEGSSYTSYWSEDEYQLELNRNVGGLGGFLNSFLINLAGAAYCPPGHGTQLGSGTGLIDPFGAIR